MRLGIRRYVSVAFVVVGLLFVRTTSAQAQSDQTPSVSAERSSTIFTPKFTASFKPAAQQPQLGPGSEDSGIGFGVSIIVVKNTFKFDEVANVDNESRNGLGFGFWVGGNRNGNVGFTGEFNFINVSGHEGEGSFKILEIPAVFHINFGSRSRNSVGGYVVVGPAFSFRLNDFTGGFGEDNFKSVDIGIIGGLGVEFFRVGIEGRGNWGMSSIGPESTGGTGAFTDIKTFKFELLGKFAFN